MKRFELRISEHDKSIIEQAAKLQGLNISAFMRQSALEIARKKLNQSKRSKS